MLPDAESNDPALAGAARPLVYDQCASAQGKTTLDSAGKIPLRSAPIAVKHQFNGCAGGEFIVFCVKRQTVERGDGHLFMGELPGLLGPLRHALVVRLVDRAFGKGNVLRVGLFGLRIVKSHAKAYKSRAQNNSGGKRQQKNQNVHKMLLNH